jgi:hypothetical protein
MPLISPAGRPRISTATALDKDPTLNIPVHQVPTGKHGHFFDQLIYTAPAPALLLAGRHMRDSAELMSA